MYKPQRWFVAATPEWICWKLNSIDRRIAVITLFKVFKSLILSSLIGFWTEFCFRILKIKVLCDISISCLHVCLHISQHIDAGWIHSIRVSVNNKWPRSWALTPSSRQSWTLIKTASWLIWLPPWTWHPTAWPHPTATGQGPRGRPSATELASLTGRCLCRREGTAWLDSQPSRPNECPLPTLTWEK